MANHADITLIGHLGPDPVLSFLADGTPVFRFNLAVNTGPKDKQTCSWYRCTLFGKRAESLAQYLTKGKEVLVVGEPSITTNTSDAGVKYTNVNVRVNDLKLLGSNQAAAPAQASPENNGVDDFDPNSDTVPF